MLPLFGKSDIGVNEFVNPSNFHFRVVSVENSFTPTPMLPLFGLIFTLYFNYFLLTIIPPRLTLFGKSHIGVNEFVNPSNFHFRVVSVENSFTPTPILPLFGLLHYILIICCSKSNLSGCLCLERVTLE